MENVKDLLGLSIPSYRQAYSDRTCWLMSCLSEIAYIKFNSLEKLKKETIALGLKVIATFDKGSTQAILVEHKNFIALAFRGTEAMNIKDIDTNCDAILTTCDSGGKVHAGFNSAYLDVATEIEDKLCDKDMPLYITGHSLGGALATIAAKKLNYKKIAACYTFGAPRVSNENWIACMKTPVYRIVNSADCVPMLPPPYVSVNIIAWILKRVSSPSESYPLTHFDKYEHGGNMRYLTNCTQGNYNGVQLLYNTHFARRLLGWYKKSIDFDKFLTDHKISVYRKKLAIIARRRNLTKHERTRAPK